MRPLSFLSQVEDAIRQLSPRALPTETSRAIDFRQGLARLQLTPDGDMVVVQCFELADGRDCLKAVVHWAESAETRDLSVYPNEVNRGTIWAQSATRLAQLWLAGAPAAATVPARSALRAAAELQATA